MATALRLDWVPAKWIPVGVVVVVLIGWSKMLVRISIKVVVVKFSWSWKPNWVEYNLGVYGIPHPGDHLGVQALPNNCA